MIMAAKRKSKPRVIFHFQMLLHFHQDGQAVILQCPLLVTITVVFKTDTVTQLPGRAFQVNRSPA